jgi:hypothetical protein
MVRTVVPQNAKTTKIEDRNSVLPEPNDINGISGSQGPRMKNISRAKGAQLENLDVFASTFIGLFFKVLCRIAHLTPQAK